MYIDTLIHIVVIAFLAWGGMLSLQCLMKADGVGFPGRGPKQA